MPEIANPASTARIGPLPIHPMLLPFPIVCFTGALVTDLAYWKTAEMMWTNISAWLLFVGIVFGVLAGIAGMIDFFTNRLVRRLAPGWIHGVGNLVVLLLALFNNFIHSHDAWTSVVPTGLVLSALTVIVMIITTWLGRSLVYRHHVGVANDVVV